MTATSTSPVTGNARAFATASMILRVCSAARAWPRPAGAGCGCVLVGPGPGVSLAIGGAPAQAVMVDTQTARAAVIRGPIRRWACAGSHRLDLSRGRVTGIGYPAARADS